jgi:fructuronate reductase
MIGKLTALCIKRMHACGVPLALVSLDNFRNNGDRLHRAVLDIATAWLENNLLTEAELSYLNNAITYPLSMIDKITPHPDKRIAAKLRETGLEDVEIQTTSKGTELALFVNTEQPQYLLIENKFPNGHPPLEQLGIIFTKRDVVSKAAKMKGCTCLNPMDTTMAVYGCLLGYSSISSEMNDPEIVTLITRMTEIEAMPMVADPGVIDPAEFLHEVLTVRYPNPYMPDTPQRITWDTSQKMNNRFGVTLSGYYDSALPKYRTSRLIYIPLAIAGWLRYLLGLDDNGEKMELSPDPLMPRLQAQLSGITLGSTVKESKLYPLLSDKSIFGVNLYEVGVGERIGELFNELIAGPGAVRATLKKYCS